MTSCLRFCLGADLATVARWLGAAVAVFLSTPLFGVGPAFHIGDCHLERDPLAHRNEILWLQTCLQAKVGAEYVYVFSEPEQAQWVGHGDGYLGLHIVPWLSLHGRGRWRDTRPLGDEVVENTNHRTDYALLRVGNPVLHKFVINAGRFRAPYGLDMTVSPESTQQYEDRRFWEFPPDGVAMIWDNLRDLRLEVGYASNEFSRVVVDPDDPPEYDDNGQLVTTEEFNSVVAARLSYDVPALDGSRMIFSGAGSQQNERRFGFAFITQGAKEDFTFFEFNRISRTVDDSPFRQLLRLGYRSAWRHDGRWIVQIDDERFRFRIGTLGHELRFFEHFTAAVSFRLIRPREDSPLLPADRDDQWAIITGLGGRL